MALYKYAYDYDYDYDVRCVAGRYITPFEHEEAAAWTSKLWQSLLNVAIFLTVIIVLSVVVVLLYKYRCYKVRRLTSLQSAAIHYVSPGRRSFVCTQWTSKMYLCVCVCN